MNFIRLDRISAAETNIDTAAVRVTCYSFGTGAFDDLLFGIGKRLTGHDKFGSLERNAASTSSTRDSGGVARGSGNTAGSPLSSLRSYPVNDLLDLVVRNKFRFGNDGAAITGHMLE